MDTSPVDLQTSPHDDVTAAPDDYWPEDVNTTPVIDSSKDINNQPKSTERTQKISETPGGKPSVVTRKPELQNKYIDDDIITTEMPRIDLSNAHEQILNIAKLSNSNGEVVEYTNMWSSRARFTNGLMSQATITLYHINIKQPQPVYKPALGIHSKNGKRYMIVDFLTDVCFRIITDQQINQIDLFKS